MPLRLTLGGQGLMIEEEVGLGATSRVYRCRCQKTGELRALKVARRPEDRSLLADEGQRLLWAASQRLPRLHAAGRINSVGDGSALPADAAGLLLDWVQGHVLSEDHGSRPESFVTAVALYVAEALEDLHAVGIAHGDIKPTNVLVEERDDRVVARVVDLGLAAHADSAVPRGGTKRYLAPEVLSAAAGGDGRTRDLWALGMLLGELLVEGGKQHTPASLVERLGQEPSGIGHVVRRLLSPHPSTRPPASWVARRARELLNLARSDEEQIEDRKRRIERTYLGGRRDQLLQAGRARAVHLAPTGVCRVWLEQTISMLGGLERLRGASRSDLGEVRIGNLEPVDRLRFLIALVGPAAASWSVGTESTDEELIERILCLASSVDPRGLTVGMLEQREPVQTGRDLGSPIELVLALKEGQHTREVLEAAEGYVALHPELSSLRRELGIRLRAVGEVGRALAVLENPNEPRLLAEAAETARRAGDRERALRFIAELGCPSDPVAAARIAATEARLLVDRGEPGRALARLESLPDSPPVEEARALAELALDHRDQAKRHAERGGVLAVTGEDRARLLSLRGMIEHAEGDALGAVESFRKAVESAAHDGSVLEEATYLTGFAAAAVDAARVSEAVAASERAVLLFEGLHRPSEAARAALNALSALVIVGALDEASVAAERATLLARQARDNRCLGYVHLALADLEMGEAEAREHAERALGLLLPFGLDDRLMAEARVYETGTDVDVAAFDAQASSEQGTITSRLEWWGARARRAAARGELGDALSIVGHLGALGASRAPLPARGRAMAGGARLATLVGLGDIARRLLVVAAEDAQQLIHFAATEHRPRLLEVPWVASVRVGSDPQILPEQVADVETLVRALGRADALRPLLNQILDALVLWTGVERGLLLLRAPGGRLVARAGRNLSRADLVGQQLLLSHSLSQRALEQGEPVVAVDASGELESVHESVHALRLRSVLAVPLMARGEALGVVYLDDRLRRGAFGARELSWVRLVAAIAAVAIAEARDRLLLRRAARRAERAEQSAGHMLAVRDVELGEVRLELSRTRGVRSTRYRYEGLIGDSLAMRDLLALVDRVVPSEVPVLVFGESGTGKELIARAIHTNGPRAKAAFVAENCGAIPEPLLESALFGHVRGAFTGAARTRAGLFEVAHQGTLFLDEVAEMSLSMQTKLLRVLEEGEFWPVGSDRPRRVDVRVIAATHRDLPKMVEQGTFRQDLFYRLNVVSLRIPPLRERHGDIPALAAYILRRFDPGGSVEISKEALELLARHPWPGNVRQLENEIRRAMVLADGCIQPENLSPELVESSRARPLASSAFNLRERLDSLSSELVRDALGRTGGNQTRAAEMLGLSRFGLQKMMRRLSVS
jgi:serine/threonine-protein kinase PknK